MKQKKGISLKEKIKNFWSEHQEDIMIGGVFFGSLTICGVLNYIIGYGAGGANFRDGIATDLFEMMDSGYLKFLDSEGNEVSMLDSVHAFMDEYNA